MRGRSETIRLGDQEWMVRPLTVLQVQLIEPLLFQSGTEPQGQVAAAVAILRVALSRDHADVVTRLDQIEATAPEIAVAMATVLRLGGFIAASGSGAASPGEAEAG